jgi:serine/threonine-protein kinase RsbW
MVDEGQPFDPSGYQKLPDSLPEGGMGLFIIRSFVDEVRYVGGPPNTLTLVKRF